MFHGPGRKGVAVNPCSKFYDGESCDNLGGAVPPCGAMTCVPASDDWVTLLKLASDYRLLAAHHAFDEMRRLTTKPGSKKSMGISSERATYLRYASEYEKRAQEAALELCDDDDTPDLEYWRKRGEEDACKGVPELFRRGRYGQVHGIGDVPEDWTAQFEHVAGTAYLEGYALAEEA